jgi:hypothetical protein
MRGASRRQKYPRTQAFGVTLMSWPYWADNQHVPTLSESSVRPVAWLWGHCRNHPPRIDADVSRRPTELQARLVALTGPAGSFEDGLWAQQIAAEPPSFWVVPTPSSDRGALSALVGPNSVVKPRMQVRLLSDHGRLVVEYWVDVVGASVAFFILGVVGLVGVAAAGGVLLGGSQLRQQSVVLWAVGLFCVLFAAKVFASARQGMMKERTLREWFRRAVDAD